MTNKERQKSVDKQKWLCSEAWSEDMSGKMFYCQYCKLRTDYETCSISQGEREQLCACATAFNRMVKKQCNGK